MTRIATVPVFIYLMVASGTSPKVAMTGLGWAAFGLFAVASFTDSLDGYLARKYRTITRLGQFLDPLADKLLVGAALVTLVALRGFPAWAAVVILGREAIVSVMRSLALRHGRSMPASLPGKIKTAIQVPMVLVWLLPRTSNLSLVQDVSVYIAVAITVVSGVVYVARYAKLMSEANKT